MKITIPKPCHENWNEMLPEDQGRFCLKCTKTVVDFSQKSKDEIKSFFKEATGKVCGRFASDQIESQKKSSFSFLQKRMTKFAMALYLVFGGFLFTSCSNNSGTLGEPNVEHIKGDVVQDIPEETMGKVIPIDTTKLESTKGNSKKLKAEVCTKTLIGDTVVVQPQIIETLGEVNIEY
ncbi:MAG: hypothetical protein ACK5B9_00535 [Flavobacteriia bacterium]|jgi:hypothetical protein